MALPLRIAPLYCRASAAHAIHALKSARFDDHGRWAERHLCLRLRHDVHVGPEVPSVPALAGCAWHRQSDALQFHPSHAVYGIDRHDCNFFAGHHGAYQLEDFGVNTRVGTEFITRVGAFASQDAVSKPCLVITNQELAQVSSADNGKQIPNLALMTPLELAAAAVLRDVIIWD